MANEALLGAVLDGRYKVLAAIADGAMGTVYRGERVQLGRAVAIKVMHEKLPTEMGARQRFQLEAKAMAQLDHPHCVPVFDVGVHEGKPYIVMELVRGKNLKDVMAEGRVSRARAIAIVRQVLSGLSHAHEVGIIHRDIKPPNIVISHKEGIGELVRILDFGLAHYRHASASSLTKGFAVGTPAYMAPEQCSGREISARTDLYAVGVVLFELLVGRRPFENDDPLEMVHMHLTKQPPRLSDVVPEDFGALEDFVARALAKDPDERFADANAMAQALRALVAPPPLREPSGPAAPPIGSGMVLSTQVQYAPPVMDTPAPAMGSRAVPLRTPVAGIAAMSRRTPVAGVAAAPAELESEPTGPRARASTTDETMPRLRPSWPRERPSSLRDLPSAPIPSSPRERRSTPLASLRERQSAPIPTSPRVRPSGPLPASPRERPNEPNDTPASDVSASGGRVVLLLVLLGFIVATFATVLASGLLAPRSPDPDTEPRASSAAPIAKQVEQLLAQGDREAAVQELVAARTAQPESAVLAYQLGRAYFVNLDTWREGLAAYRDAIRLDPASYREDAAMIGDVMRAFVVTPDFAPLASFLHDDVGHAAMPFLDEIARTHANATIRARATDELRRYHTH